MRGYALRAYVGLALFAVLLSRGPAHATFPGDVGLIAFDDGGSARVVKPDGTGRRLLLSGSQIDWSPDATQVVYWVFGNGIWVADADGRNARKLASDGSSPAWSRDGQQIVYEGPSSVLKIIRVSDGGLVRELPVRGRFPTWSPVADRIAYAESQQYECDLGGGLQSYNGARLALIDAVGGDPTYLTDDTCRKTGGVGHIDWSPDGTKLLFTGYPQDGNHTRGGDIFVVGAGGGEPTNLTYGWTFNPPTAYDPFEGFASWSPDGTMIAFASNIDAFQTTNIHDLWLMDASGGNRRRIALGSDRAYDVDWGSVTDAARFTWAQTGPDTIRFDASASTGVVTRYEWRFGDSPTPEDTTDPVIDHVYDDPGDYSVRLTTFDAAGQIGTTTRLVTVASGALSLSMTPETPLPQGARSGDRIVYRIDAQPTATAAELVVTATFREDIVELDPDSITQQGVHQGGTIRWTLTNTDGTTPPLEFAVVVRGSGLPAQLLFVPASAEAVATFGNDTENAEADGTVPYLRTLVGLDLEAVTRREGKVGPEEEIRYLLRPDLAEPPDAIDIELPLPKYTTLVADSVTAGGTTRKGVVRWHFTGAPPAELELRVTVAARKKLTDVAEIAATATAVATYGDREEERAASAATDVVLPGTLRGVVRDIVFAYPRSVRVDHSSALGGIEVTLRDDSGAVVDATTTGGNGKFVLDIPPDGVTYTLEASGKADFHSWSTDSLDKASRIVQDRFRVRLSEEGELTVEGKTQPGNPRDGFEPIESYVPLSLVTRTSQLIRSVYNYQVTYLFLVPFDVKDLFANVFPYYDVSTASGALDAAIALEDFIRPDGYPAHFAGPFQDDDPHDPWNAMIRLCIFLAQFEKRQTEAIQLADALSKAVAIAVVTNFVSKGLPKLNKALDRKLGKDDTFVPLTATEHALKTGKIGMMAFGVGVGLPLLLDGLGISGPEKAEWIERIAKGARYGFDFYVRKKGYLSAELDRDLTFEALFFAMRVGTLSGALNFYHTLSQGPLDEAGDALRRGIYGGDTFRVIAATNAVDANVETRTNTILTAFASVLGDVSLIRGLDGMVKVGAPLLSGKVPGDRGTLTRKVKAVLLKPVTKMGGFLKKHAGWLTIAQFEIIVGGIIDEFVLRGADLRELSQTALYATNTAPRTTLPAALRTARGRPELPKILPSVELSTYLAALDRVTEAIRDKDATGYQAEMAAFLAAHDALFDPIDALYDRAALAFPLLTGPERDAAQTFIDTRHAAGPMVSVGYGAFDLWQSSPGDSVLRGAAKAFFAGLAERVREVSTGFALALPVLDGLSVPGGIVVRSVGEPDAEAVTGGLPFTLTFRLANPGDTPVAAAEAELGCGDGLALDGDASQSVPALAAGTEVLLAWSVHATPNGPGGFTGHCQLLVMRGEEVLTHWDEPILEYVPEE